MGVSETYLQWFRERYQRGSRKRKSELLRNSALTIDRILKPVRARYGKSPSGTKPGTLLREEIAIQGTSWARAFLDSPQVNTSSKKDSRCS